MAKTNQKDHSLHVLKMLLGKLKAVRVPTGVSTAASEYFMFTVEYGPYISLLASALIKHGNINAAPENVKRAIDDMKSFEAECGIRLKELQAYSHMIDEITIEYMKCAEKVKP